MNFQRETYNYSDNLVIFSGYEDKKEDVPQFFYSDYYSYGFQGQERDDEAKGSGNSINYKFRMHDPRLGRFFAVDPLASSYPFYSPYSFSGNRVIDMIELEGLEPAQSGSYGGQGGQAPIIDDETGHYTVGTENTRWVWNNDTWTQSSTAVTSSDLKTIFPNGNSDALKSVEINLNLNGSSFGINSYRAMAHFLSQAGQETGGFSSVSTTESLNYSVSRLTSIFGKYFYSGTAVDDKFDAGDYGRKTGQAADQSGIGNIVYANRMGNGNSESGDGYNFRGRGVFQLTGRSNYTSFQSFYNSNYSPKIDIISDPGSLASNPDLSIKSALWYFKSRVSDKLDLQTSTVKQVTKRVNGGYHGLTGRRSYFNTATKTLGN